MHVLSRCLPLNSRGWWSFHAPSPSTYLPLEVHWIQTTFWYKSLKPCMMFYLCKILNMLDECLHLQDQILFHDTFISFSLLFFKWICLFHLFFFFLLISFEKDIIYFLFDWNEWITLISYSWWINKNMQKLYLPLPFSAFSCMVWPFPCIFSLSVG